MTCHLGYTPQHAVFVLLYFAVLLWAAPRRHALPSTCSVLAVVYHAGMAGACESASVSDALHGYSDGDPFARLRVRLAYDFVFVVSLAWMALGRISQGTGRFKAPMMASVLAPALASAFFMCWAWSSTGGIEDIIPQYFAAHGMSKVLSWVSILTETGSATMIRSTYWLSGLMTISSLLRTVYSTDFTGRVMPRTAADAAHPHWSATPAAALEDLSLFISAAVAYSICHTRPQPVVPLPMLTSHIKKLPLMHIAIALVSMAVFLVAGWVSSSVTADLNGNMRGLLSAYTVQEGSSVWWLAVAGCAAFGVGLSVVVCVVVLVSATN